MKISTLIISALALSGIAACGQSASTGSTSGSGEVAVAGTALGDVFLGDADAPVTIIEYASITCSHCKAFHEEIFPSIQDRIDSGEVKFIFRDFPTPPVDIALAGFAIARCSGEDTYFDVVDDFFTNQTNMIQAARTGTVENFLKTVAARHGVDEAEYQACTRDDVLYDSMLDIVDGGQTMGVTGTPTFFLNGTKMGREAQDPAGLNAAIDAALGIKPGSSSETEE
ncbi:MAG: disulfide bond formation protein DsbA [Ponticaulis sp.]|nr:disulfide bond formation protein DsbA [Ponticaulis sp.]